MRNSKRQHLILATFSSVGNQNVKFQLNLPTQTIVTAAFERSFLNVYCLSVSIFHNSLFNPDMLQSVTCHMGSHFVSCHRTQVNATQARLDLPTWEGGVDLGVGYIPRWFTCSSTVTHPCRY